MIRQVLRARRHDIGETLYFCTPNGSKRSPTKFFSTDQVPEFEGEQAWFEVEPCRGPIWPTWKFIRQVEEPKPEVPLKPSGWIATESLPMVRYQTVLIEHADRQWSGRWSLENGEVRLATAYGVGRMPAHGDPDNAAEKLFRELVGNYCEKVSARRVLK